MPASRERRGTRSIRKGSNDFAVKPPTSGSATTMQMWPSSQFSNPRRAMRSGTASWMQRSDSSPAHSMAIRLTLPCPPKNAQTLWLSKSQCVIEPSASPCSSWRTPASRSSLPTSRSSWMASRTQRPPTAQATPLAVALLRPHRAWNRCCSKSGQKRGSKAQHNRTWRNTAYPVQAKHDRAQQNLTPR